MRGARMAMVAAVFVTATTAESEARIRLSDAQISAGVLVVGGWTRERNASVSLDGKFTTMSDKRRRFTFRLPYVPENCIVTLKSGAFTRTAAITNCGGLGVAAKSEPGLPHPPLRPITRECRESEACSLTCAEGEIALAAVCSGSPAVLDDARTISCPNRPAATVTAFCGR